MSKLKRKNPLIERKVDQKLRILALNPHHPSLRIHKLKGRHESWSISVDMGLRMLFVYREYGILLIDIGSHEDVY